MNKKEREDRRNAAERWLADIQIADSYYVEVHNDGSFSIQAQRYDAFTIMRRIAAANGTFQRGRGKKIRFRMPLGVSK